MVAYYFWCNGPAYVSALPGESETDVADDDDALSQDHSRATVPTTTAAPTELQTPHLCLLLLLCLRRRSISTSNVHTRI